MAKQEQQLSQILDRIYELISQSQQALVTAKSPESNDLGTEPVLAKLPSTLALKKLLNSLHRADVADLLESLPPEERLLIWYLLPSKLAAYVLIEVPPRLRQPLLDALNKQSIINLVMHLDSDELVDIMPYLSPNLMTEIVSSLDEKASLEFKQARQFNESQVGSVMDFDYITVRDDVTCKVVLRYLRQFDELPAKTDQIFIVDDNNRLVGTVPLRKLVVSEAKTPITEMMTKDIHTFSPYENVEDVANAFERYDLTTAAVIDKQHHLIGRLTIDEMVDVLRAASEEDVFIMAGFNSVQDVFSPVLEAFKSRWLWLVVNLCTAFFTSRVIGLFEGSIERIVALAALMPIVAGLGGNAGNQTITMIVRTMSRITFNWTQVKAMLVNELLVALVNGFIWGSVLGSITWWMYDYPKLGLVMMLAMTLNLLLAATMGVMIPYLMQRLGRDPALGSSVMITACTDSGGFFIFLGLASLLL